MAGIIESVKGISENMDFSAWKSPHGMGVKIQGNIRFCVTRLCSEAVLTDEKAELVVRDIQSTILHNLYGGDLVDVLCRLKRMALKGVCLSASVEDLDFLYKLDEIVGVITRPPLPKYDFAQWGVLAGEEEE